MSKGFVVGGGGTPLKFKVIGGTVLPASSKENTIWVNTDTEITAWTLSGSAPKNPIEGEVWLAIGASGTVTLNLLKKNAVNIAIFNGKQYISGEWVAKESMIYQNGLWGYTIAYAYYKGDLFESFTGGWNAMGIKTSSDYPKAAAPKVTYNAESIKLVEGSGTTNQQSGRFHTVNKIDLTPFETVTINVNAITVDGHLSLTVVSEHGTYRADNRKASLNLSGTGRKTLDISAVNEPCYICIDMYRNSSITFDEVVLDV